jgi:hypothetical protein
VLCEVAAELLLPNVSADSPLMEAGLDSLGAFSTAICHVAYALLQATRSNCEPPLAHHTLARTI